MAVISNSYNPTEHLILAKPRRHFRTGVRWQHWQLRSLVGTKGQNAVYFPVLSGSAPHPVHVQQLNTTTGEQETVKHLGFIPMCLVARNGWVCAGGERGAFSSFRVGETIEEMSVDDRLGLAHDRHLLALGELDDRAPIPIDNPAAEEDIFASLARARAEKNMLARNKIIGKQRVNGITLWFPPTLQEPFVGAYDQGVAVLANNDKSVTVVSLREQEALDEITYPDFMNLAVLSPDGRLLVAISDDPYLYIHERTEKQYDEESGEKQDHASGIPFRTPHKRRPWENHGPSFVWKQCGKIQLIGQSKEDRSDSRSMPPVLDPYRTHGRMLTINRGSFAACFSSTGKYLAVGTQYGTISIFNVAAFTRPEGEPLITHFQTSRSTVEFGAVRAMEFSPGPVDLLAWTEDRGRVGIADSRTGFDSRQIIQFDDDSDYEHITVTDRSTIDPRLLDQRSDGNRGSPETSTSAGTSDRPGRTSELLEHLNIPLTAEETVVLEAIQDHRRRQEQWAANLTRMGMDNPTSTGSGSGNASGGGSGTGSGTGSGSGAGRRAGTGSGTLNSGRAGGESGSRRGPLSAWQTRDRTANVSRAVDDILSTMQARELTRNRLMHGLTSSERTTTGEGATASISTTDRPTSDNPPTSRDNATATTTAAATNNNASNAPTTERRRYDSNPSLRTSANTSSRSLVSRAEINERLARFHRLAAITNNPSFLDAPPPPSNWDNAEALYGPPSLVIIRTIHSASAGSRDAGQIHIGEATDHANSWVFSANYLMRDWEDGSRRIFGSYVAGQIRPEPYDTAGLSWSENGDILYVGSSSGIYEFRVDKRNRRLFPSITPS